MNTNTHGALQEMLLESTGSMALLLHRVWDGVHRHLIIAKPLKWSPVALEVGHHQSGRSDTQVTLGLINRKKYTIVKKGRPSYSNALSLYRSMSLSLSTRGNIITLKVEVR